MSGSGCPRFAARAVSSLWVQAGADAIPPSLRACASAPATAWGTLPAQVAVDVVAHRVTRTGLPAQAVGALDVRQPQLLRHLGFPRRQGRSGWRPAGRSGAQRAEGNLIATPQHACRQKQRHLKWFVFYSVTSNGTRGGGGGVVLELLHRVLQDDQVPRLQALLAHPRRLGLFVHHLEGLPDLRQAREPPVVLVVFQPLREVTRRCAGPNRIYLPVVLL